MNVRSPVLVICAVAIMAGAPLLAAVGCGGKAKQDITSAPESLSTLTADQIREKAAIPDLGCKDCSSQSVVDQKALSASEAEVVINANKDASGMYEQAGKLGYHDVVQGLTTTYSGGATIDSALIRSDDRGVAILSTGSGAAAGTVLAQIDPEKPDEIVVTDGEGSATIAWTGKLIGSVETHNSCHYWHCVGAAVSWLYTDTWYADWLGAFCDQCAEDGDEYTCGICLASLPSGLLASVATCGMDSCDFCDDDSCGDDIVKSRQCRVDPSTIGSGLTQIYKLWDTVDDYSCANPGGGNSQCVVSANTQRLVQVCPGDCGSDGASCAPATPRACDPAACAAKSTVSSAKTCHHRQVMRWTWYEVWWTGRNWSCQPDGAGGNVCVPGPEGWHYARCMHGWGCSAGACVPPSATPTRTGTPTRMATPIGTPTPIATPTRTGTPTRTLTPGPSPTKAPTKRATPPYQRK